MPEIVKLTPVNRIEVRASLSWAELEHLINQAVAQKIMEKPEQIAGFSCADFKVRLVQEEEGSPSYKVDRWSVCVDVVLRPDPLPMAGASGA